MDPVVGSYWYVHGVKNYGQERITSIDYGGELITTRNVGSGETHTYERVRSLRESRRVGFTEYACASRSDEIVQLSPHKDL